MNRQGLAALARPTVDIGVGADDPPLENLVAIKFDLLSDEKLRACSVFDREAISSRDQLLDPRLGLPTVGDVCTTCRATDFPDCPGHFGHIKLAQPIYHPSFVAHVKRFLARVCLACGSLRMKKKPTAVQELIESLASVPDFVDVDVKVEPTVIIGDDPVPVPTKVVGRPPRAGKGGASGAGAGASSSQASTSKSGKRKAEISLALVAVGEEDVENGKGGNRNYWLRPRKKRSSKAEFVDLTDGGDEDDDPGLALALVPSTPTAPGTPINVIPIFQPREQAIRASQKNTKNAKAGEKKSVRGRRCKYCQPSFFKDGFQYPAISLKVVSKTAGHTKDKIECIEMEIKPEDDLGLEFWDFLGEEEDDDDDSVEFPLKRELLPSSALKIFQKVSSESRRKIGIMNPESMIIQHLPVPPNCVRVVDEDLFGATSSDYGDDKTTHFLKMILQRNNNCKSKKIRASLQWELLQGLIGQYFRMKGASKVSGGLEPRMGQNRLSEQSLKTKWKTRLKDCVVGKVSNHCARSVIYGDPFMRIDEIGIPDEIAKMVTVPERVNSISLAKVQRVVQEVKDLGPKASLAKRGVPYYERDGEITATAKNPDWEPQIGDVAYRFLMDGDLVFVNRNPSLHKHSLVALRVRRHSPTAIALNPLLCGPLNADFDGDALHVFAPQSFEVLGEMRELMTVPQQMISPQGGQVMIRLTQDALLGAHLLTSSGVFVDKPAMGQLMCETSSSMPQPAILKSPNSGPLWTGAQVFSLTLPAALDYTHSSGVLISKGELLRCGGASDWLGSSPESIVGQICSKLGPESAVGHLNIAQYVIHGWLLMRGFSIGLDDVYATKDSASRKKLTRAIKEEFRIRKRRILDHPLVSGNLRKKRVSALEDFDYMDLDGDDELLQKVEQIISRSKDKHKEEIAVVEFRGLPAIIERLITSQMAQSNSLLRMVKSGSKGSMAKVVQQSGLLGLQLNVGAKLLPQKKSSKFKYGAPLQQGGDDGEAWEGCGVVGSSFLEGLSPVEFFTHAMSSRLATISQCLDVREPGSLFKSLMCFLRDVYVAHDGTVRTRLGQCIIQYFYGGALAACGTTGMDEKSMREVCQTAAGEPVGVLAVTALVQPLYQAILDTPHQSGIKDMRPLELLQETLLPRFMSLAKPCDRKVILRLRKPSICNCNTELYGCSCVEKIAVQVQNHLRKLSLDKLVTGMAIVFEQQDGGTVSPWIGHIQVSLEELEYHELTIEVVLFQLEKLVTEPKNAKILGHVEFSKCTSCNSSKSNGGPCIRIRTEYSLQSPTLPESLEFTKYTLLPALLKTVVKGSNLIQSVNILWETRVSPYRISETDPEETVVEVVTQGKQPRGKSFSIVKLACIPIMDLVDWSRSSPYSIQELRQSHGIEAAYHCILHRLKIAVKSMGTAVHPHHLQLIADFMAFTGDAVGFMYAGYKDYIRSISCSAPFTQGAFQAPWKSFTDAAQKGESETVNGVLSSCAWGKRAPIGTGADFEVRYVARDTAKLLEVDIHEFYGEVAAEVARLRPVPEIPHPVMDVASPGAADMETGGWDTKGNAASEAWDTKGNAASEAWDTAKGSGKPSFGEWGNEPKGGNKKEPASSPGWGGGDSTENAGAGGWGDKLTAGWGTDRAEDTAGKTPHDEWGSVGATGWGTAKRTDSGRSEEQGSKNDGWGDTTKSANGAGGWADAKVPQVSDEWGGKAVAGDTGDGGAQIPSAGGWDDDVAGGWGDAGKAAAGETDEWGKPPPSGGGWEDDAPGGWDTAGKTAADDPGQLEDKWGKAQSVAGHDDVAPPARPAPRHDKPFDDFSGGRRRKQDTSCSGANTEPLGKNRFWNKGALSVSHKPDDNVQPAAESGASGAWRIDVGSQETAGKRNADDAGIGGWGNKQKAVEEPSGTPEVGGQAGGWAKPRDARGRGKPVEADARGWAKAVEADAGGWAKAVEADAGGWAKTVEADAGGWAKPVEADAGGWGKAVEADEGGWGKPVEADTGGWGKPFEADEGGWGKPVEADEGGWGKPVEADTGGWGKADTNESGWGAKNDDLGPVKDTGGPGAFESEQKPAGGRGRGRGRGRGSWATGDGEQTGRQIGRPPRAPGAQPPRAARFQAAPVLSPEDDAVKNEIAEILQKVQEILEKGGKLSDEDAKFIIEKVLAHHPDKETKTNGGIDHVKADSHPQYPANRCLLIVQTDGSETDLSHHRCMQEHARSKSKVLFENYSLFFKPRPPKQPRAEQE